MGSEKKIPYKIYLNEDELPKSWYNVRADMKNKPAPLLNPATLKPMTADDLKAVFCDELIAQELDETNAYIPIPEEIVDFYKMYRPSPLVRAYCLEKKLQTPAKIYYKFEGNNTSGSHKLNSAIAQAYYAKKQGLKGVTTETGAGMFSKNLLSDFCSCAWRRSDFCSVCTHNFTSEWLLFVRNFYHINLTVKSEIRFLLNIPAQQEVSDVQSLRQSKPNHARKVTAMFSEAFSIRYFSTRL